MRGADAGAGGHKIDDFHNMQVLLVACRELVTGYNMFSEMLCAFAHLLFYEPGSAYPHCTVLADQYIVNDFLE